MSNFIIKDSILKKYHGPGGDIIIPDGVTSIGYRAFLHCSNLTSITIPDGITSIGSYAFRGCYKLTSINISDGVTSIGSYAFRDCYNLTKINIPDRVTSICDSAFYGCSSLTNITIPDSVTSIGNWAFRDCSSLTNITIPDGVTSIGAHAFRDCSSLTSINIPDSVTSIGYGTFEGCSSLTSINIPDSIPDWVIENIVREIKYYSSSVVNVNFLNSPDINIKSRIEIISDNKRKLIRKLIADKKIKLFQGAMNYAGFLTVQNIDLLIEYAFEKKSYEILSQLLLYKYNNFEFTIEYFNKYIKMAKGNAEITAQLLKYKNNKFSLKDNEKKEPGSHEKILAEWDKIYRFEINGKEAIITGYKVKEFKSEIIIPAKMGRKTVVAIADGAFSPRILSEECQKRWQKEKIIANLKNVQSITIPDTVTSIGSSAFSGCKSLENITIPNSVTSIGDDAFSGCESLKNIIIPDSVFNIGRGVFYGCKSLKNINVPDALNVDDRLTYGCESLQGITDPELLSDINEFQIEKRSLIRVRSDKETILIPFAVTSIDGMRRAHSHENHYYGAFFDAKSLRNVIIPNSVTCIGDYAFDGQGKYVNSKWIRGCDLLENIMIPDLVTSIGKSAFRGCSSLTSITIPDSVTSIGNHAFKYTPWLKNKQKENPLVIVNGILVDGTTCSGNVSIPDSVTEISNWAFEGCSSLTSITIPDSVTSIGDRAFSRYGWSDESILNSISFSDIEITRTSISEFDLFINNINDYLRIFTGNMKDPEKTLECFDKCMERFKDNTEITAYLLEKKNRLFSIEDTVQNEWDAMEAELAKMEEEMNAIL